MTGCALLSTIISFLPCNCFCKRKYKLAKKCEHKSSVDNEKKSALQLDKITEADSQHVGINGISEPQTQLAPESVCQNGCEDVTKKQSDQSGVSETVASEKNFKW
ncbi:hypothetical protein AVEN_68197-1 [Araneus ventricosus]|uniref:Uncharacterized protein n=1 Tax=Araneus ventricosus TaxID=182803 RepID=A0A4Y2VTN0_ARAVE|nr:hypothetical protein AVEN_68197-1 [Araneus ventricosus]